MPSPLFLEVESLKKGPVFGKILERHSDFKSFESKSEEDWFSELCFCLLTANCSADSGIKVQNALGFEGFYNLPQKKLSQELRNLGYRFYNRRAEFISCARKEFGVKENLSSFSTDQEKRSYLVDNVKGLGMKEASHFLRNTGHDNLAILDRHILRAMHENSLIHEMPKSLTLKNYSSLESALGLLAEETGLNQSLLDLSLWYMKTGKILK